MKPSGTDKVCEMYDASADGYSEMMDSEINLPVYSDTLSRLHQIIESMTGTLIDTACGSGHLLSMYHDQYDKNRPLLGIDLSPRMVAIVSKRLGSGSKVMVGDDFYRVLDALGWANVSLFPIEQSKQGGNHR